MVFEPVDDTQLDVRERADRQRDLVVAQPRDQPRVLETPHAVIDARHVQQIERLPHIRGRPFFARVRDGLEAVGTRTREDVGEE